VDRDDERILDADRISEHLKLKHPGTIGQMIHDGKITEADGWIKIGKLNRFVAETVLARCQEPVRQGSGQGRPRGRAQAAGTEAPRRQLKPAGGRSNERDLQSPESSKAMAAGKQAGSVAG
jgi:hypothetical protein